MQRSAKHMVRPLVHELNAYVPGEQPKIRGLIKLNTNENPYPPSPKVLRAVKAAADGRLRLYPNPAADALRKKLANLHGCSPEHIIVGNGSDEVLAMAVRGFVEPLAAGKRSSRKPDSRCVVQYFHPSYSLYPVLADIHGAARNAVSLRGDFSMPTVTELRRGKAWDFNAALSIVTTPNAPSGKGYSVDELDSLCKQQKGVVILDEAYVDFAPENAMNLALKHPHVLVARTFSKAYSLCFQRVGYLVGNPELIAALHKIRDSYNVNGLGQIAAEATLDDPKYYQGNFRKIIATRESLIRELTKLGFRVLPSATNFIFAQPPGLPAQDWLQRLRDQRILVRWFNQDGIREYLRITIGTPAESEALVKAVRKILKSA